MRVRRVVLEISLLRVAATLGCVAAALAPRSSACDKGVGFFEKKIRPVLVAKCYSCHSAEAAASRKLKGGLQLDTREGIRAGGESGPAVVPGDAAGSLLIQAMRRETFEMPPDERLTDDIVEDFVKWIESSATDPRDGSPVAVSDAIDYELGRRHWAYQPLDPGSPLQVRDRSWPAGDIDRYLLARMEAGGLSPAPDAAPLAVLRRLCFDLTGLPPTLEQVRRFERLTTEQAAAAYQQLVGELLDSPHFGEQWARHWLDGVRFNPQIETAAYYRNWVIQALNDDLPYHEFLRRQIAGDLIDAESRQEAAGNVIATQLLAHNRLEADFVEASLEVLGQQMLGISLNCAKCHDHKYDAVSQEDYYALAGILKSCKVPKAARDGVQLPGSDTKILTIFEAEPKRIGDTYLLLGGDSSRRGELIPRRLPHVFFEGDPPAIESDQVSGRLELARWIGDPGNPLAARVLVNRVWQRLMGRGIVPTANDFGANGEPPTHPRLLDHLARRLIQSNGSLKAVVREVVLSRAYRQSVHGSPRAFVEDSGNELLTRAAPKRLQFEQIMDQLLAVGGQLELGMVEPAPLNKWPTQRRKDKSYGGPRTIYARPDDHIRRTFDGPNPELLVVERARSVTAPQALHFLNGEMVRNMSEAAAQRIQSMQDSDDRASLIRDAYRVLLARLPEPDEIELGAKFIEQHGFQRYVHALVCTNEFMHLN